MNPVIITDLDGTLVDHFTYSAFEAAGAVQLAQEASIPICICSSKTRSEIQHYREMLRIRDPFISENGGAVFIPEGYFQGNTSASGKEAFEVIELGTPYRTLVEALKQTSARLGTRIHGFHELSAAEVAAQTGLPVQLAEMALDREYDEPFWIDGGPEEMAAVEAALQGRSLQVTRGGRFHHVLGGSDKGRAVGLLEERFRKHRPDVFFIGIGDSPNDIPMLQRVDIAILVRKPSGSHDDATQRAVPKVHLADGVGPSGWNTSIKALLKEWT